MSRIVRKIMKIFGSAAGTNQLGQIGSLAAGSIAYTTDPATMQALSNYASGMYSVAVGQNSVAIQDWNSLFYLDSYQLSYLMQSGIPEWEVGTTYYIGSFASDGAGFFYRSLTDNNIGNALTDATKWITVGGNSLVTTKTNTNYAILDNDHLGTILFSTGGTNRTATLPSPANNSGRTIVLKKIDNGVGLVTIGPFASETIDGASSKVLSLQWDTLTLQTDGTNWYVRNLHAGAFFDDTFTNNYSATQADTQQTSRVLGPGTWMITSTLEINLSVSASWANIIGKLFAPTNSLIFGVDYMSDLTTAYVNNNEQFIGTLQEIITVAPGSTTTVAFKISGARGSGNCTFSGHTTYVRLTGN